MSDLHYFKIDNPRSESSRKLESNFRSKIENLIVRTLSKTFPNANPDYEEQILQVSFWKIEIENEYVSREIGYSEKGESIMAMPDNRNYGFWSDSHLKLTDFKDMGAQKIDQEDFIKDWNQFNEISKKSNKP